MASRQCEHLISVLSTRSIDKCIKATRLVTSSEDDASPIVMAWDLRNARAPEKVMHSLSLLLAVFHMLVDINWTRERRPFLVLV